MNKCFIQSVFKTQQRKTRSLKLKNLSLFQLFQKALAAVSQVNFPALISRENDNKVTHQIERSSLRAKMTLKISFKEYYLNPKLNITFIPNVSTGCTNSSILKF